MVVVEVVVVEFEKEFGGEVLGRNVRKCGLVFDIVYMWVGF